MSRLKPLERLRDAQADATAPRGHRFVSASAGTGKTHVLTARVLRLLLHGADPSSILCITFTKAGAAEMAARINQRLTAWVRMPEADLGGELVALGETPAPEMRHRARTLFARVLEAPGGLRIQTIHSFAQSLLASFPIEAGVAPGFAAIDERSAAQLLDRVLAEMLVRAEREGDGLLLSDLAYLSLRAGEGGVRSLLTRHAHAWTQLEQIRSRDSIEPKLRAMLELPIDGPLDALLVAACGDDRLDTRGLARFAQTLIADGGGRAVVRGEKLQAWLGLSPAGRATELDPYFDAFLKQKPRDPFSPLCTASMRRIAGMEALAQELCDACCALLDRSRRIALAGHLSAGLRAGWTLAQAYAQEKARAGVIDYDDMIARAAGLLAGDGLGAWVRYKLDQRFSHILVDEAQDTNRDQWTIVERLAEEFFAGEGARPGWRTLFAVGDFKQAIFSFQGTDPREFERARTFFEEQAGRAEQQFAALDLGTSFRSTPAVLSLVDAVIEGLGHEAFGVTAPIPPHVANRAGQAGKVALWPLQRGEDGEEEATGELTWLPDAKRKLADKIAQQIAEWIETGELLEAQGRPLRAEDILILVRSRDEFVRLLVARLHELKVPVAGVDRINLAKPLVVQDLLALVRFALQPEDDLALASLLVSPFLGWSQDELFALAHGRPSTLWAALRARGETPARDWLGRVLALADLRSPYEFFEILLSGPAEGRRRLLGRMGEEARDAIEEVLNAAFAFETVNPPSLQGFLDWVERSDIEVKRDPSAPRDAVRIMTVHGAKGLQAPVVILADAAKEPNRQLDCIDMGLEDGGPEVPLFPGARDGWCAPVTGRMEDARRRDLQEHWRLMYVALTRAEDVLIVAGTLGENKKQPHDDCWYAHVQRALGRLGVEPEEHPRWPGQMVYRSGGARKAKPPRQRVQLATPDVPAWARALPAAEPRPTRPLSPSALGEDEVADPPIFAGAGDAARRGSLLHALFERLPPVAPERRRAVAESWLDRPGRAPEAAFRAALIDDALRVIEEPRFAEVFSGSALAETPIAAVLPRGDVIAGTVDRLLVEDQRVLVVDFKTGSRAPATAADVPDYHLRQMAAYVAALEVVFPGRTVEAALLYTAGPSLIALDDATLAAHRPSAASAEHSIA